jgi:hypothetical protein
MLTGDEVCIQSNLLVKQSTDMEQLQHRRLLNPTTRARGKVPNATQPPVTQTGDIQHGSSATPFRRPPATRSASLSLPDQVPAHDAQVSNASSTIFIAQSMGRMGGQYPPVVPNALRDQEFPHKRVRGDNHGVTDPSAEDYAFQVPTYHDSRTAAKHSGFNSLEKGVRNNSPEKGVKRSSTKPQPAAQDSSEQRFTPTLSNPPVRQTHLPEQVQARSGKMNHTQYTQYPQQSQYMQQPQHVQYPQQSASAINMAAPDEQYRVRSTWLQYSQEDLAGRVITEIPGIPFQHIVDWLDKPSPMLVPHNVWFLRSLNHQERYNVYQLLVSTARLWVSTPVIHPQHEQAWMQIRAISARLVQGERVWHAHFRSGTWALPHLRRQELLRITQSQAQGMVVNPAYAQRFNLPSLLQSSSVKLNQ